MKKAMLIIIFIAVINTLTAAHVLVWNYDPQDTFYDPEIGQTIDCDYWIVQSLSALGHTYQVWNDTLLPSNLDPYDVIMGTFGWYRC